MTTPQEELHKQWCTTCGSRTCDVPLGFAHQCTRCKCEGVALVDIAGEYVCDDCVKRSAENAITSSPGLPMLLWCPSCHERHIDVGEFAVKPHHTHACQHCGMVWRPAIVETVGVEFLPGFKND